MRALDVGAAARATDWLDLGEDAWRDTVGDGPRCGAARARLQLGTTPGGDCPRDIDVLLEAVVVLARWTTTPDDLVVCVWGGWGVDEFERRWGPATLTSPARSYHVLQASLTELAGWGRWPAAEGTHPAFVWPEDRAWCLACDVDPDWAGISAPREAIDHLLREPGLDLRLLASQG